MTRAACVVFAMAVFLSLWPVWTAGGAPVRSDEEMLFFPSPGFRAADGKWELEINASVFEREPRRALLALFRKGMGLGGVEMGPAEAELFNQRARPFLKDNERGKEIAIRIGDQLHKLGRTAANGRLTARLTLAEEELRTLRSSAEARASVIPFAADLPVRDRRAFTGAVHLLEPEGLSVISDIDDTIKISEVTDHQALLRNTFLKPFQPVPGMASLYQRWSAKPGAQFHYVSASPWQLYEPLAAFIRSNGYPAGTFHLKEFRWKDQSFRNLFASPEAYKTSVIGPLLKRCPQRRFVLVGDSGERDPEIYGQLAREHPGQILRIFIREVGDQAPDAPRYQAAFRGLRPGTFRIFRDPREIEGDIP